MILSKLDMLNGYMLFLFGFYSHFICTMPFTPLKYEIICAENAIYCGSINSGAFRDRASSPIGPPFIPALRHSGASPDTPRNGTHLRRAGEGNATTFYIKRKLSRMECAARGGPGTETLIDERILVQRRASEN